MEVRSVNTVKCKTCGAVFAEYEMSIPGHCPACLSPNVEEMVTAILLDDRELETLWCIFGDIPMDPVTEQIEDSFIGFPAGTHREEIWHWFDERYTGGVHALMEEVD